MQRYYENSEVAKQYAKFRPHYNEQVREIIIDFLQERIKSDVGGGKFDLLLDVGCGSGQATKLFAPRFKKVKASDVSVNQIEQARRHNQMEHVTYKVGCAESHPDVADGSVDLLISAQAAHWFDHPKFFQEAIRILKPGGVIALFGYGPTPYLPKNFTGDKKKLMMEQMKMAGDVFGSGFGDRFGKYQSLVRRYQDLMDMMPFDEKKRNDDVVHNSECRKIDVEGMVRSWDAVDSCVQKKYEEVRARGEEVTEELKKKVDPVPAFMEKFAKSFGFTSADDPDFLLDLSLEIFIVMGRKSS